MVKVQEVYKYTANIDKYSEVLLAANNNNAVNTDRTAVTNNVFTLYDKSSTKDVGKVLYNAFKSVFYKKVNTKDTADIIIFDVNFCLFFDDDLDSYITYNIVYNSKDGYIDENKTFVAKATGTGGKYIGKDVTVFLKTDNSKGRKVILEYEK
jgi:hypothetical protein